MAGIATAALVGGAIKGVAGIAGGIIGSRKRKREERAAQREMEANKTEYYLSKPFWKTQDLSKLGKASLSQRKKKKSGKWRKVVNNIEMTQNVKRYRLYDVKTDLRVAVVSLDEIKMLCKKGFTVFAEKNGFACKA